MEGEREREREIEREREREREREGEGSGAGSCSFALAKLYTCIMEDLGQDKPNVGVLLFCCCCCVSPVHPFSGLESLSAKRTVQPDVNVKILIGWGIGTAIIAAVDQSVSISSGEQSMVDCTRRPQAVFLVFTVSYMYWDVDLCQASSSLQCASRIVDECLLLPHS